MLLFSGLGQSEVLGADLDPVVDADGYGEEFEEEGEDEEDEVDVGGNDGLGVVDEENGHDVENYFVEEEHYLLDGLVGEDVELEDHKVVGDERYVYSVYDVGTGLSRHCQHDHHSCHPGVAPKLHPLLIGVLLVLLTHRVPAYLQKGHQEDEDHYSNGLPEVLVGRGGPKVVEYLLDCVKEEGRKDPPVDRLV